MNKKQKKGGSTMNQRPRHNTAFREENTGKKRVNVNSMLRMEHLQKLATWASVEAGISPIGALFGRRLAACAEAEGVPLDSSTFTCHRCESVLRPGFNCNVRVEGNTKKVKRRKKRHIPTKNSVVYNCHFCSHSNRMIGTQKGYVKGLLASRQRPNAVSKFQCSSNNTICNLEEGSSDNRQLHENVGQEIPTVAILNCKSDAATKEVSSEKGPLTPAIREIPSEKSPVTPLERLSNSARKKRKTSGSSAKKPPVSGDSSAMVNAVEGTVGSSRRKRKGWSSLKEIAESNEALRTQTISNFAIPFLLQVDK